MYWNRCIYAYVLGLLHTRMLQLVTLVIAINALDVVVHMYRNEASTIPIKVSTSVLNVMVAAAGQPKRLHKILKRNDRAFWLVDRRRNEFI